MRFFTKKELERHNNRRERQGKWKGEVCLCEILLDSLESGPITKQFLIDLKKTSEYCLTRGFRGFSKE